MLFTCHILELLHTSEWSHIAIFSSVALVCCSFKHIVDLFPHCFPFILLWSLRSRLLYPITAEAELIWHRCLLRALSCCGPWPFCIVLTFKGPNTLLTNSNFCQQSSITFDGESWSHHVYTSWCFWYLLSEAGVVGICCELGHYTLTLHFIKRGASNVRSFTY